MTTGEKIAAKWYPKDGSDGIMAIRHELATRIDAELESKAERIQEKLHQWAPIISDNHIRDVGLNIHDIILKP
jgi:hypothetical protein